MAVINIPYQTKKYLDDSKRSWESFDALLNRLMDNLPVQYQMTPKRKFQVYQSIRLSDETKKRLDSFVSLGENYTSKIHDMLLLERLKHNLSVQ